MRFSVAGTLFLLLLAVSSPAHAWIVSDEVALDSAALADMESRAVHAQAREQAFLYTELVQSYVTVASKQMAAGDLEQANDSLKHVQTFADRIHRGLAKDSKRLKNAEMLLHLATYRLGQLMHAISSEDAALLRVTLKQLDKLHDELLAQVFAH
jgi:flagellin-specific chaperone FliS